ncbi:MAG: ketoacyl-ACP synthase III [Bacteroidaceae bacterium]|nr:ketoacyl-ACP synthase III [Bacteroidaceae bacterium]
MAHQIIRNVATVGITTCVPSAIEENISQPFFKEGEAEKVIASTGIERRRIAPPNVTASDLCFKAAEKLLEEIGWAREDIDGLIFVSQSQDYLMPATSCILQHRLGLPVSCCTFDISYGCSGWVYGMSVASSMLAAGTMKKVLLLVGDTPSKFKSRKDKTAWPLFGDAGTATALEYQQGAPEMFFSLFVDGSKFDSIIIRDGGCRHPFSTSSLEEKEIEEGVVRRPLDSVMNGMNVFSFGLKRAPEVVNDVLALSQHQVDDPDYYIFHQANMFMNEKIRKKLGIPAEKVPYSMKDYGNTSCATIPLTINTTFGTADMLRGKTVVGTAFGVGLSWGSVLLTLDNLKHLSLIEYNEESI